MLKRLLIVMSTLLVCISDLNAKKKNSNDKEGSEAEGVTFTSSDILPYLVIIDCGGCVGSGFLAEDGDYVFVCL